MIQIYSLQQIRKGDLILGITNDFEVILEVEYFNENECHIYIPSGYEGGKYTRHTIDFRDIQPTQTFNNPNSFVRIFREEKNIINQIPSKKEIEELSKIVEDDLKSKKGNIVAGKALKH